jgi:hypothetical protein
MLIDALYRHRASSNNYEGSTMNSENRNIDVNATLRLLSSLKSSVYDRDRDKALAMINNITNQLTDEPHSERCERCNSVLEHPHTGWCIYCWEKLTRIK